MQYHIIVSGKVQGVGFRWFTVNCARAFNITGWVRNDFNGNVEILAQGNDENLNAFIDKIKLGPSSANVAHLNINKSIETEKFDIFEVVS